MAGLDLWQLHHVQRQMVIDAQLEAARYKGADEGTLRMIAEGEWDKAEGDGKGFSAETQRTAQRAQRTAR